MALTFEDTPVYLIIWKGLTCKCCIVVRTSPLCCEINPSVNWHVSHTLSFASRFHFHAISASDEMQQPHVFVAMLINRERGKELCAFHVIDIVIHITNRSIRVSSLLRAFYYGIFLSFSPGGIDCLFSGSCQGSKSFKRSRVMFLREENQLVRRHM